MNTNIVFHLRNTKKYRPGYYTYYMELFKDILLCILGNPGVIHYVSLHSSPLGQLTDETSFSMNIHNTGEYLNS